MCGAPLREAPPERRKPATLVFCDIAGSTALGERIDAESVAEFSSAYFEQMRAALERHGGTVGSHRRRCRRCVRRPGCPRGRRMRALRAATEMRERIAVLNDELEQRFFGVRLAVRIGVNSGEVVVGDAAASSSSSAATPSTSPRGWRRRPVRARCWSGSCRTRPRDAAEVEPGRAAVPEGQVGAGARPYRLVSVDVGVLPRPPAQRTPMVGRDAELARLVAAFDLAVESRFGRAVLIAGEAASASRGSSEIGTTIGPMSECSSAGASPTATASPTGHSLRSSASLPVSTRWTASRRCACASPAWSRASRGPAPSLRCSPTCSGSAPASRARAKWVRRLAACFRASIGRPACAGRLRRPALGGGTVPRAGRGARRRTAGGTGPPDWADQSQLSNAALAETEVGAAPGEGDDAPRRGAPRRRDARADLSRRRAGAATGGNPLFAEELVAVLVDNRSSAEIPPTLDTLLRARLDLLPAAELIVAERAAVEGVVFTPAPSRSSAAWT